jgi:hypothetical protein
MILAEAEPLDWERVLRQAVVPVAAAYAGWLLILRAYRRGPGPRAAVPSPGAEPTYRDLVRYLLRTAVMGYLLFLLVVGVFYLVLGDETPELLVDAAGGGAVLAFGIAVPGLLITSWLYDRRA